VGNYPVGVTPEDLAAADLNGDGSLDLAVPGGGGDIAILLGDGRGSFHLAPPVTSPGVNGLKIADFDADGHADLAAADCVHSRVLVFRGTGNATFTPAGSYPVATCPQGLAASDFSGDGRPDLAATSSLSGTLSVLINASTGCPSAVRLTVPHK